VIDPIFSTVIVWSLALLFAAAGLRKLAAPASFAAAVDSYMLLPGSAVPLAAWALIGAELIAAGGLVVSAFVPVPWALPLAAGLLVTYALAMGINLARGRRSLGCGCTGLGSGETPLGGVLVARNLVLSGTALAAAAPVATGRILTLADGMTILGSVLSLALLYLCLDQYQSNLTALKGASR
jgi:hypothetical protein